MKNELLDDDFSFKSINSRDDIKRALRGIGIDSFYEHKNGSIIVEDGDAVKLAIYYEDGLVRLKPKFPTIGNSLQILASAILLGIFLFIIPVPFPLQWVIAIVGGQLISYMVHMPKTKRLQERIERFL